MIKTLFQRVAVGTVCLLMVANILGAQLSQHYTANGSASTFTNAVTITQIIIANTNATTSGYAVLFDAPGSTNQYWIGAYTNYIPTQMAKTNTYTNYFGVVNSNVFSSYLTNVENDVAAFSNLYPVVLTFDYGSNSTLVINGTWRAMQGILLTNTASADITFTYRQ